MPPIIRPVLANSRKLIGPIGAVMVLVATHGIALAAAASETPSAGDTALFDRLDADHNQSIAADEVATENRALFDRLVRRADTNHDHALSREEFVAGLVPTRPAKPMEAKEPSTVPQANAVRYMLLTLDSNRNARIEKDEASRELKGAADMIIERMDKNGNGALERQELSGGGPAMSAVAGRYVDRLGIDVDAELAKLKKSEGEAFNRFEQQPMPLTDIRDSKQARQLFAQFDENADGKLDPKEVPDPLQEPIGRLVRISDRDGDGKLTQDEFVTGTDRISKLLKRGRPEQMEQKMTKRDAKAERKAKSGDATPVKK